MNRLTAIILLLATVAAAASSRWADEAARRKADYMFLESQLRELDGKNDAAFDLLSAARQLDPSDRTIGYNLAVYLLELRDNDSAYLQRARNLIAQYLEENPGDYYGSVTYASLLEFQGETDNAIAVWERIRTYHPDDMRLTYGLAKALQKRRDTASVRRAVALYDTLEDLGAAATELAMQKLRLLYQLGDTNEINRRLDNMLTGPGRRNSKNLVMAAQVHVAIDHFKTAEELLKEACAADSTDGYACYSLAAYYNHIGDSVGYRREVYNALMRPSLDYETKEVLLTEYVTRNAEDSLQVPRVRELLEKMVDMYPHEANVRDLYGRFLGQEGEYDEAIEQTVYAVDADPSNPDRWELLCRLYGLDNRYDDIIATTGRALHFFPLNKNFILLRVIGYQALDSMDRAIEVLRSDIARVESLMSQDSATALEEDEPIDMSEYDGEEVEIVEEEVDDVAFPDEFTQRDLAQLYSLVGDMCQSRKRPEEAVEAYEKSLSLDPDNHSTLNNYAYCLALNDTDLDKARRMVERAMMLAPHDLNAVDTYAWVMFQMKEYPRAREIFDSAIDRLLDPDAVNAEVLEHAGDIYFMTGDHEKAIEFWKQALEEDPDNELLKRKVENRTFFFK